MTTAPGAMTLFAFTTLLLFCSSCASDHAAAKQAAAEQAASDRMAAEEFAGGHPTIYTFCEFPRYGYDPQTGLNYKPIAGGAIRGDIAGGAMSHNNAIYSYLERHPEAASLSNRAAGAYISHAAHGAKGNQ
jgi:hypothetical protein